MAITTFKGPVVGAKDSPQYPVPSNNADYGPSLFDVALAIVDPRMGLRRDVVPGSTWAVGLPPLGHMVAIDAVPSAIATANIAAAQHTTSGVPLTLVSTSGAGITVLSSPFTSLQTGQTVASGVAIDGLPSVLFFGPNNTTGIPDPRTSLARAVSITASGGGGAFLVTGADLYGMPQTETITATSAATVDGHKGFKFVTSVTPQFTDATNTYSVGTSDIYEFPLAVYEWAYADIYWNGALITASTGFTAADTTSPATSTTHSVRGTYATQSASNGTISLQMFLAVQPWVMGTANGAASLFGVTPA